MDNKFKIGDYVVLANFEGDKRADALGGVAGEIVAVTFDTIIPYYRVNIDKQSVSEAFVSYYDSLQINRHYNFNNAENIYLNVPSKYLEFAFELPEVIVNNADELFK